jgi:hypothetical protein
MIHHSDLKMNSNKKTGRITGVLLLLIFISGIVMYQILQGPNLFAENFLTTASGSANQIIISTLLGILSGVTSIVIASLLLPIFKRHSYTLAFLYLAFCIIHFVAIAIDNVSVLSMLEVSMEYAKNGTNNADVLETMASLLYEKHWWTHYLTLLISCLPVFVLYYTFYFSRLVPSAISVFGMVAVMLMFTEILVSLFGNSISMNMLLPMGLIQLVLPIWLLFKGLSTPLEKNGLLP